MGDGDKLSAYRMAVGIAFLGCWRVAYIQWVTSYYMSPRAAPVGPVVQDPAHNLRESCHRHVALIGVDRRVP